MSVTWDRRRPSWIRAAQEKALGRYMGRVVYPYSPYYRARFDEAGLGQRSVRSREDLTALPLTTVDDVDDPTALIVRPDEHSIQQFGELSLVARVFWAKVWRREWTVNQRLIDPEYKPLHWHVQSGIPMGSSAEDLERLAELGRRWLELAGVRPYDVLVSIHPFGPNLPYWELVLGARRAGLSALYLPPSVTVEQIAAARPNVLAGRAGDLLRLLEAADGTDALAELHTLLVTGDRLEDGTRRQLAAHLPAPDAAVVSAWAPPGVRALWAECRFGEGLHTAPDTEVIEIIDPLSGVVLNRAGDGEVVWTSLGWKGTVFVRLRTGVYGTLDESTCGACGRSTPRLRLAGAEPPFARILNSHPDVSTWQAELRTVDGHEELVVFLTTTANGHPGHVLRELDRHLSVTQFVVLDRRSLESRLAEHDDRRVVDLRG